MKNSSGQFRLEDRLDYLQSLEQMTAKSLSCEEATKNYTAKNVEEKKYFRTALVYLKLLCQAAHLKIILFFWITCKFWYFFSFFKFEIYCHLCHVL